MTTWRKCLPPNTSELTFITNSTRIITLIKELMEGGKLSMDLKMGLKDTYLRISLQIKIYYMDVRFWNALSLKSDGESEKRSKRNL